MEAPPQLAMAQAAHRMDSRSGPGHQRCSAQLHAAAQGIPAPWRLLWRWPPLLQGGLPGERRSAAGPTAAALPPWHSPPPLEVARLCWCWESRGGWMPR